MSNQAPITAVSKAELLRTLRGKIKHLEGFKMDPCGASLQFGVPEIDQSFPDGSMPLGAAHEFISDSPENTAATSSFIAAMLSRLNQSSGTVLWISKSKTLYAPGLLPFGLDPNRVVFIHVGNDRQALWAIEEALRAKGLMAVVGEIGNADMTATRRLQLAVEKSGTTGFLLRVPKREHSSVCVGRWRIQHITSEETKGLPGVGNARWRVDLEKVRHGQPGQWDLEWNDGFSLIRPKAVSTISSALSSWKRA